MSRDAQEDLSGSTLGPYRVDAKLGAGGMGVVYRARDTRLDRDVAIKVLPAALAGNGERRARFLREAKSAAAVNHQNIAAVYDVGESEGRIYIAMELVEGTTLRARLVRGALQAEEAVRLARGIAAGLARAHEKGIVHRDLKPENVMVTPEGGVKILDFGLAKLRESDSTDSALANQDTQTLEGRVMGTPGYMSPEQAAGRPVTQTTDVYALGAVMHEMLTGGLPGLGTGRKPIADGRLEAIVARCLDPWPDRRWPDAGSVLAALEASGAAPRPSSRRTGPMVVIAAAAVALAGAAGVALREARTSAVAPPTPASPAVAAAPTATTLADLPLPASSVSQAVAEYKAGIQLVRDDSYVPAFARFVRAGELDPGMALAHLRAALVGRNVAGADVVHREFATAVALRAQLSERDRVLLDALEPLLGRVAADEGEALTRLQAAHERYPLDAELAVILATESMGDPERGPSLARRATELDPNDAEAWELLGRSEGLADRIEESRHALETCTRISVESSDCYYWLGRLDAEMGRCDDMERSALREADVDPKYGYLNLALASYARGASEGTVREMVGRHVGALPQDERAVAAARFEAHLAVLSGRFDAALRQLDDLDRALAATSGTKLTLHPYALSTELRVHVLDELGDAAGARAAAQALADRLDVLLQGEREGQGPGPHLWLIARAGQPMDPRRREWFDAQTRSGASASLVWEQAWAATASTPGEAVDALALLRGDAGLRAPGPGLVMLSSDGFDWRTGRAYLLAGRAVDALPYLRRAASDCFALLNPFAHVLAALDLGRALEQTADAKGACEAYAQVLARWGHATPRSVSAEAARAGVKRLHCTQ